MEFADVESGYCFLQQKIQTVCGLKLVFVSNNCRYNITTGSHKVTKGNNTFDGFPPICFIVSI